MQHRLTDPIQVLKFVTAGNSVFTLKSVNTGVHYTFRVTKAPPLPDFPNRPSVYFVSVLVGPDNTRNYLYFGTISGASMLFKMGDKAKVMTGALSVQALMWFWRNLMELHCIRPEVEFYHEGRCGRCGKKLTSPESLELGLGPECANKHN